MKTKDMKEDGFYTVKGFNGVAWYYRGPETEPDEDTVWSGIENPTGKVIMVMVGDDREFVFDPDDIESIESNKFCHECGQLGCRVYEPY